MTSRRFVALLVSGALLWVSCAGEDTPEGGITPAESTGPNEAPPPTLSGGIELVAVDPLQVLVGDGLAFGLPLPSEQSGADAFTESPEVSSATLRRVHSLPDGRRLGQVLVLALDGREIFDQGVLDAFTRGVVEALGDGTAIDGVVGGRPVLRSTGQAGATIGFLEGNLMVIVQGAEPDAAIVVERQLAAIASGAVGLPDPVTPLVPLPIDAAFVPVATVAFQPIPPPEDEPAPEPPGLSGASGVQGRYGVVAGERRTIIWAYTVDTAVYSSAEALEPAMAGLASSRAGGAATEAVEVFDRLVQRATGAPGVPSARVFRHEGLVLLVEGFDPAQVDAVVSAWIHAL